MTLGHLQAMLKVMAGSGKQSNDRLEIMTCDPLSGKWVAAQVTLEREAETLRVTVKPRPLEIRQ